MTVVRGVESLQPDGIASRLAILLLLLIAAACGYGERDAAVIRRDSAGVSLVQYGALPADEQRVWRLAAEPTFNAGGDDTHPDATFSSVLGAATLSDGSIVTADSRTREFRVFDRIGTLLRKFGGAGRGPGEFEWLSLAWSVLDGDSLMAWDLELRRLTVFGPDGSVARTTTPAIPVHHRTSFVRVVDATRLVVIPDESRALRFSDAMVRDTFTITIWDARTPARLDTIAPIPYEKTYINEHSSFTTVPFTPTPVWVVTDSRLYVADGARFSFRVLAHDGAPERIVSIAEEPASVQDAEIRAYEDAGHDSRFLGRLPYPTHHPILEGILVDRAGNVWVRRYAAVPGESRTWHAFAGDGAYLARVEIPEKFWPFEIGEDYILGSWRDDLGIQTLRIYAIEKAR